MLCVLVAEAHQIVLVNGVEPEVSVSVVAGERRLHG